MSDRTRRQRFLGPKPRLSARELDYLTDVDHVTHEALVAIDETTGEIVGSGATPPAPTAARRLIWRWPSSTTGNAAASGTGSPRGSSSAPARTA